MTATLKQYRRQAEKLARRLPDMPEIDTELVGRGLGLASLGIAAAELAVPGQIEKMLGIRDGRNTGILRVLGVRELMSGLDLLGHDDPGPGLWSRVVGDALDLALLGAAATRSKNRSGLATAALMVLGITALDVWCAKRHESRRR